MSLCDMDNVTIGFILDLVEENNREVTESEEPTVATTEIIDKFFQEVRTVAGTIKGMTIEIGGNTAPLEQALKSTNKEINATQKE